MLKIEPSRVVKRDPRYSGVLNTYVWQVRRSPIECGFDRVRIADQVAHPVSTPSLPCEYSKAVPFGPDAIDPGSTR